MGPRGGDELNLIVARPQLRLAARVRTASITTACRSRVTRRGHGFEAPKIVLERLRSHRPSLVIYSGNLFPQWKGSGFIGALSGEALIRVTFNGDQARKAEQWDMGARIRFVDQGPEGALYLLEDGPGGRLLRLEPKGR